MLRCSSITPWVVIIFACVFSTNHPTLHTTSHRFTFFASLLHTYIGNTVPYTASSTAFLTSSSSPPLPIPCLGDLRLGLVLMAAIEWSLLMARVCIRLIYTYVPSLDSTSSCMYPFYVALSCATLCGIVDMHLLLLVSIILTYHPPLYTSSLYSVGRSYRLSLT